MSNNGDMPANPIANEGWPSGFNIVTEGGREDYCIGLTKREQFAMAAMQGLLSGGYCIDDAKNRINDVPQEAVNLADSLLLELEK